MLPLFRGENIKPLSEDRPQIWASATKPTSHILTRKAQVNKQTPADQRYLSARYVLGTEAGGNKGKNKASALEEHTK